MTKTLRIALVVATGVCMSLFQRSEALQSTTMIRSLSQLQSSSIDSPLYSMRLDMKQGAGDESLTKRTLGLSAASIADDWAIEGNSILPDGGFLKDSILPVVSTALLITGNTIGAGMLVLPDLAAGPGMGLSTAIFVGAFIMNLLSGLVIAEVAINQHDSSGSDVPSSFKEFAEASLNSSSAANVIAGISVFVNALVYAFNFAKVGEVGAATFSGVSEEVVSMAWAAGCVALAATQSFSSLSNITSLFVTGLFVSFAGLLLPGLAHMADPMTVLMTPGTSPDVVASAGSLAPVVLMSLIYQNIVPTVTKILNYDRTKTTIALSLGSFIPLLMYLAWTFAVLGHGVDTSVGMDGPLMTIFSLSTIAGSSIGCQMSLSEEFDTFFKSKEDETENVTKSDTFSIPAVLASIAVTVVAGNFFADDLTSTLKVAGSFGSPLLYGAIPAAMAYTQRKEQANNSRNLLPGGMGSLGFLGASATGFLGCEVFQGLGEMMTSIPI